MAGDIVFDGATGQAIVASTGTPVDTILEALQSGDSHGDVLRAHPGLAVEDIVAAVRFARRAVQRGVRYPTGDEMPRTAQSVVREPAAAYGAARSRGASLVSGCKSKSCNWLHVDSSGFCDFAAENTCDSSIF